MGDIMSYIYTCESEKSELKEIAIDEFFLRVRKDSKKD